MQSKAPKIHYFDYAAATPLDASVLATMLPYLGSQFANPSSLYTAARATRLAVEDARKTVATILAAKPTEIVFTSGGTEGNNLAIQGVLRAHPGAHWVTTAIEHDAVLRQADALKSLGHDVAVVPVSPQGIAAAKDIAAAITDRTVLVSIMYANNEIGTIQPLAEVARLITATRNDRLKRGIKTPLLLHTDAVQAAPYLSLHVDRLGVDLLTLSGSKIYGPKGSGVLYVKTGTPIEPLVYGGGQERGRRSGTENVAGLVGFAAALSLIDQKRDEDATRIAKLKDALLDRLMRELPDIVLNGDKSRRLPNNLNLTIPGVEGEGLVLYLDNYGILASTGSACTTGSLEPSHVLLAIGLTPARANSSLRLTLGRATNQADIDALAQALPTIVTRLRQL